MNLDDLLAAMAEQSAQDDTYGLALSTVQLAYALKAQREEDGRVPYTLRTLCGVHAARREQDAREEDGRVPVGEEGEDDV